VVRAWRAAARYRRSKALFRRIARPESIALALVQLGLRETYVADLDAIAGAAPAVSSMTPSPRCGLPAIGSMRVCRVGANARARATDRRRPSRWQDHCRLESLPSWSCSPKCGRFVGSERLIFSLDLKQGWPLTQVSDWHRWRLSKSAATAVNAVCGRMIVPIWQQVGSGQGVARRSSAAGCGVAFPSWRSPRAAACEAAAEPGILASRGARRIAGPRASHAPPAVISNSGSDSATARRGPPCPRLVPEPTCARSSTIIRRTPHSQLSPRFCSTASGLQSDTWVTRPALLQTRLKISRSLPTISRISASNSQLGSDSARQ